MEFHSLVSKAHQRKIDILLTTVLGIGFLKPSPGTFGSLAAILLILISPQYYFLMLIVLVLLTIISFFSIKRIEVEFGDDASIIVIDEFLALGLVYLSGILPNDLIIIILAFVFFRIFDIFKPFPINLINQKKGAFYVLADDFLAAIFMIITIKLLIFINNLYHIFIFLN